MITKNLKPKEEPKEDYSGVHFRHCYQGEYEDGCKYGEDDCPAKPKEEPKQEFTTVNGSSGCIIKITDEKGNPLTYWGGLKEPKQETTMRETIEEAAKNYANYNEQINKAVQEAVKFGAKWQQEQDKNKFSEEDMHKAYCAGSDFDMSCLKGEQYYMFKEWFEQFSK